MYIFTFFKHFIYLFSENATEKERERNINVWLPFVSPQVGTWPETQACALTGNQTNNPMVHRTVLNPLTHSRQGAFKFFSVKTLV